MLSHSTPSSTQQINAENFQRQGWFAGQHGVCIVKKSQLSGLGYYITFWKLDALSPQEQKAWASIKEKHAQEREQAGLRSAYGKLAALDTQLIEDFEQYVEHPLHCGKQPFSYTLADLELLTAMESGCDYELIACCLLENHGHALITLSGEIGIDQCINSWSQTYPELFDSQYIYTIMPSASWSLLTQDIVQEIGPLLAQVNDSSLISNKPKSANFHHITVLLNETVDLMQPCSGKVFIDATLGGGGHTEQLLEQGAEVWGIDQDPEARIAASLRLSRFGSRLNILAGNFGNLQSLLASHGIQHVDGIIADLGISSHQVDSAERGFSFREDGPLDMRMNPQVQQTAANLVNTLTEQELANIIWMYGEEKNSRTIARAIVKTRTTQSIERTSQLANLIASILPRKGKLHPATKTFQALRIAVNQELDALERLLVASTELLNTNGRLAIISFHSLEDRMVKRFFDYHSKPEIDRKEWPAPRPNPDYCFRLLTRHPITPSESELSSNPRSRSAKLRAVEKIR